MGIVEFGTKPEPPKSYYLVASDPQVKDHTIGNKSRLKIYAQNIQFGPCYQKLLRSPRSTESRYHLLGRGRMGNLAHGTKTVLSLKHIR